MQSKTTRQPWTLKLWDNFKFTADLVNLGIVRDVRFQILIWFQTFFLLFTKPHFQTYNALKKHIFSDYFRLFLTYAVTPLYCWNECIFLLTQPDHHKSFICDELTPKRSFSMQIHQGKIMELNCSSMERCNESEKQKYNHGT